MEAVMIPILYEKNETSFGSNWGLGFISDLLSCTVTEERNGEFILEAVLSCESAIYPEIQTQRIIYAQTADRKQPFKIYYVSKPINGKITIKAEQLARHMMRYGVMGPLSVDYDPDNLTQTWDFLDKYGSASNIHFFRFYGYDTGTAVFPKHKKPLSGKDYMGGVEGSILDRNHCEYAYDGLDIFAYKERGSDRGAVIRYGRDMTDFKAEEDLLTVYNGVLPYFYKEDTGTYVQGTASYKNTAAFSEQRLQLLDLSSDYESTTPTAAQLTAKGQSFIARSDFGVPKINFTINLVPIWAAIDHGGVTDQAGLVDLRLCDTAQVIFDRLGIAAQAKVIKTEYDVLKERISKITLGNEKPSLPRTMAQMIKKTGVKV